MAEKESSKLKTDVATLRTQLEEGMNILLSVMSESFLLSNMS